MPAAQTAVTKGGTLIYLEQQPHTNLYPPAGGFYPNGGVLNQITDKLTYQNPKTLEIEPWIAESWTVNADATEYTFKIRPGVTFSDGTPLDAAAVAKNFDTYGLGNKELKQPVSEVITNYKGSEVVDPLTVKFFFTKPSVGFLQGTSVIGSGLVSLKTLALPFDALGDATKIIGSGPFVVKSEVLGRELVMEARKDYKWGPAKLAHQGRANLDGIKYVVTPEDSVRIGALLAGQANVIRQVQAYDEKQVQSKGYIDLCRLDARREQHGRVPARQSPGLRHPRAQGAAACHQRQGDRGDAVLRQLSAGQVDHRLDRAGLCRPVGQARLRPGAGRQAARRGRLDDRRRRACARRTARSWCSQAYESPPQPQNKETLQLVAQQWAKVGVKLNVLAGDAGSRVADSLDPAKTPVAPAMVGRADPDVIRSQYYPTTRNILLQKGGVSNKVQNFVDEKLNGLLEEIAAATDPVKRMALVGEVQAYVIDQGYVIPIFEEPQAFAASPKVQGLHLRGGRPAELLHDLDREVGAAAGHGALSPRPDRAGAGGAGAHLHGGLPAAAGAAGRRDHDQVHEPRHGPHGRPDRRDPRLLRRGPAAVGALLHDASATSSPAISASRSRPACR